MNLNEVFEGGGADLREFLKVPSRGLSGVTEGILSISERI